MPTHDCNHLMTLTFGVTIFFILAAMAYQAYLGKKSRIENEESEAPSEKPEETKTHEDELSAEQIAAIRRHNNLFEEVPLYNGQEWKTLSIEELVQVCLASRDAVYVMHGGKHTPAVILKETIDRCRSLASWMSSKKYSRFYMDSDMSHLIDKPMAVAARLDEINMK